MRNPDIVIIGSGMGGASVAAGLSGSGAKVMILEKGHQLPDIPETRDARAIFQRGFFRPDVMWRDKDGAFFNPGNYNYVGGNTKFFGAVLFRYRKEDFAELEFAEGGVSPAWPFSYEELEPWYSRAEQLYQARGSIGDDATEPRHSQPYPHPPVPDEPAIARVRERLKSAGLHPASLPLGVDIDRWLQRAQTPFDAFPDARTGKMDAETCGLAAALADPDISLETGAEVIRLETGEANRISAIVYRQNGEEKRLSPKIVILSAGAVHSALMLLKSADGRNPNGLANSSDQVGRNFMNHNATFMLAIDPFTINDSIYQKTLHFNDFYFDDGNGGGPLGQVQLLGKVSAPILKSQVNWMPEWALQQVSKRSVDWYLVSEDLPRPESRVRWDGDTIVLEWRPSNMQAHHGLVALTKERMRAAGYPIILTQLVDGRLPSHQCGTVRMGNDPASAPLDPWCRSYDHPNLFVIDAAFLPTSAAVNPSLTIAAQALRAAAHIRDKELAA
ncbi:MAG: GMC family oxidoreductase [Hyphomicrobiaceae bacterium]|nr:GMC family oxidoreductase [Hyphomicrobiaceae bacterium]MCC0022797.1 GMC family oxidoreductase [Hyphomicrobiaceae bacterium]